MIQDVKPEQVFWLHDGKSIKNIAELARELKQMNAELFLYHVNDAKNDFANWIQYCIKDAQLGTLVRTTKNQQRMAAIIERRIQELTQPPKREKAAQIIIQPTIIRTKNITPLKVKHEPTVIKTSNVTPLEITQKKNIIKTDKITPLIIAEPPKERIETPHKTQLHLTHQQPQKEIYVHEIKKHHHSATLYISHLILGIVIGVAIAALAIMFN
jgi:hypothetical protein